MFEYRNVNECGYGFKATFYPKFVVLRSITEGETLNCLEPLSAFDGMYIRVKKEKGRYMKELCLCAHCLVAVMAGCTQQGQTPPADSSDSTAVAAVDAGIDKHSEAYIRQRLDTIYGHIRQMIAAETEDNRTYISSAFNLDSTYCSSRYYSLMKQALAITNETGDILFDYDHWVCGQDYSKDWHYKIQKISDITDSTATAEMEIINFGNVNDLSLSLLMSAATGTSDEFGDSVAPETDQDYFRNIISDGLKTREKAKALVGEWGWVGEKLS